jgi:hypothetical protein
VAKQESLTFQEARTLRRDAWWLEPLLVIATLGSFAVYATWAALQNAHYYADPYLSPFYSPCIAANCAHVSLPLIGSWWNLSPAILILWAPGGFRLTCYYYRKAYYRSFFGLPPGCGVRDLARSYFGEMRFPFTLQRYHRYFFWLSIPILVFLWWDAIMAFRFPSGFGIGVGTLVLLINAALLSLYSLSCHSCRHFCGGHLDTLSQAPARYRAWKIVTRLNEKHMLYAWISLVWVAFTDFYVRMLSMGVIQDLRILF